LGEWNWIHSLPAAVAVLTIVLYPLSMLITEAAVRGIEPRLEEAASLAARPGRVLWRITLPLVMPSVLAAALVIFVLAVSDFGVPALLRVRVSRPRFSPRSQRFMTSCVPQRSRFPSFS